ncbi:UNVERIFIED_CONTAM: LINE-1 retrotransposable element O protein, partial [Sesamum latifolium]
CNTMANGSMIAAGSMDLILNILGPMHVAELCKDPTLEEVRVIFYMASDSTTGPDGFSARFYQACREIIKYDIFEAVEDFLKGTPLRLSFTATSIVLIPKVKNSSRWNEFHPISLCNTTDKLLTKILNDRSKSDGFVRGHQIGDNILSVQEIMHSIGANKTDWNVALKLDMAKAYD